MLRYRGNVAARDAPGALFARPDSRVAIDAPRSRAAYLHGQAGAKSDDRDVAADATNSELGGHVLAKVHDARAMRREVLRLRPQLSIGPRKQQLLGNQSIECRDISRELCRAKLGFELDNLRVVRSNQNRLERKYFEIRHGPAA